jgi:hypothetical protein
MIRLINILNVSMELEDYLEICLESYLELGKRGYSSFNNIGGLENIEIYFDGFLYARVYGRKIYMFRSPKICDDETYVRDTITVEGSEVYRKLPEYLVDGCVDEKIYPVYNYVRPDRILSWLFRHEIPYYVWEKYTENEKHLMRVNENTPGIKYKLSVFHSECRNSCYIIWNWREKIE